METANSLKKQQNISELILRIKELLKQMKNTKIIETNKMF